MAFSTAARACQTIGDDARCHRYVEPLLAAADEHGFSQYLALGRCLLGWLTARQGDIAAGLAATSEAVEVLASLGGQREMAYANALMADVLIWAGRWSDAVSLLDETLRRSAATGVVAFDAKLLTSKAAALAKLDSEIAATEQQFEHAIDVARRQSARLFELQACSGLARLWLGQGWNKKARLVLEPVLARFTEAQNLPDFRAAREILDACGP
jgi:adenylate cyclase